ncbi:MAG: inositol monophosphatase family protein [Pseudomonadota bacterium]
MDSDALLAFAHSLADAAAKETLPRFRNETAITNKLDEGFDPVTEADRTAEQVIRLLIEERFPTHGIKGEEFGEKTGNGRHRWVIDSIDGTRAFICGVPVWTTLIALEEDGVPILGIIDQPFLKERWVGYSQRDEQVLDVTEPLQTQTSGCEAIGEARLMVTDMRAGEYLTETEAVDVARLAGCCRVTRQGLDSYAVGLVASGDMDLVVEAGLHWHDIAAAIPVIKAAGGTITDWNGEPLRDTHQSVKSIIAATKPLAKAASSIRVA